MELQERSPSVSAEAYARGVGLYCRGDHERAIEELDAVRGGDLLGKLAVFYRAMAHRELGLRALRSGQYDAAERHLRSAAATIGSEARVGAYLLAVLARRGAGGQVPAELDRAAGADRQDEGSARLLAMAQWQAGRRMQAYMTILEALRNQGGRADLHLQLGVFYAAEGRYAEARGCFARAAEADCTNWEAHRYLALAAAATGDVRSALRSFQRALSLRPADTMLAYQLALSARAASHEGWHVVLHVP